MGPVPSAKTVWKLVRRKIPLECTPSKWPLEYRRQGVIGYKMKLLIAVAVVQQNQSLLTGIRAEHATFAGKWEFPGGKVEPGETPQQAAVRECLEETGILVEVTDEYPPAATAVDGAELSIRFFRCRPVGGNRPLPPFVWTPLEKLNADNFPPANRSLIAHLASELNG